MVQLQERGDDLINLGTKMDEKLNSWSWGASANSDFSRLMRDTRQVVQKSDNSSELDPVPKYTYIQL